MCQNERWGGTGSRKKLDPYKKISARSQTWLEQSEEGRKEQGEMRFRGRLNDYRRQRDAVLVSYCNDNAAEQMTQHSVA